MYEQAAATTVAGSPGTAGWLSAGLGALGNIIPAFAPNGGGKETVIVQQAPAKNNTMLYVVGAVLLMVVLYFVFKSKKA